MSDDGAASDADSTQGYGNTDDPDEDDPNAGNNDPSGPDGPAGGIGLGGFDTGLPSETMSLSIPTEQKGLLGKLGEFGKPSLESMGIIGINGQPIGRAPAAEESLAGQLGGVPNDDPGSDEGGDTDSFTLHPTITPLMAPPPSILAPTVVAPPINYGPKQSGYWDGNQFIFPPVGLLGG